MEKRSRNEKGEQIAATCAKSSRSDAFENSYENSHNPFFQMEMTEENTTNPFISLQNTTTEFRPREIQSGVWENNLYLKPSRTQQHSNAGSGLVSELTTKYLRRAGSFSPLPLNVSDGIFKVTEATETEIFDCAGKSLDSCCLSTSVEKEGSECDESFSETADLQSTESQSTKSQSIDLQSTDLQSTELQSAQSQSADLQSSELPFAELQSSELPSTELPSANSPARSETRVGEFVCNKTLKKHSRRPPPSLCAEMFPFVRQSLRTIVSMQHSLENRVGASLFDNYAYREFCIVDELRRNNCAPGLEWCGGRSGPDASSTWGSISVKSSLLAHNARRISTRTGFGEWCRQHSEAARRDALLCDYAGVAYGVFRRHSPDPLLVVFVRGREALEKHALLVREQQDLFRTRSEDARFRRDSIRIRLASLYKTLCPRQDYDLIFDGERLVGNELDAFIDRLRSKNGVSLEPVSANGADANGSASFEPESASNFILQQDATFEEYSAHNDVDSSGNCEVLELKNTLMESLLDESQFPGERDSKSFCEEHLRKTKISSTNEVLSNSAGCCSAFVRKETST